LSQVSTILNVLNKTHHIKRDADGATRLLETLECKEYMNKLVRAHNNKEDNNDDKMIVKPESELVGAFCTLKTCLDSNYLSLRQVLTILNVLGKAHHIKLDYDGATRLSETLECKEYMNRLVRANNNKEDNNEDKNYQNN
jgi:hypothetical protein